MCKQKSSLWNILRQAKIMDLAHLDVKCYFDSAINKLIIDRIQNISSFIAEHFGFLKYSLNKVD